MLYGFTVAGTGAPPPRVGFPIGATATLENPLGCNPGRNAGRPQPTYWQTGLREAVTENLDAFPSGIDVAFLGAWIENESDGRRGLVSSLGEVGLFQIHPDEIIDMVGSARAPAYTQAIKGSLTDDIRAGGDLLRHYDAAIAPFGIPRGTRLYHGLLKVMHSSRPRGVRWLEHVTAVLGRPPHSFDEFLATAVRLKQGTIQPRILSSLPTALPSCAPGALLARRDAFLVPGEPRGFPSENRLGEVGALYRNVTMADAAATMMLLGAFPMMFSTPLPFTYATVSSGWGRPRPERNGTHEGIDMHAPVGTPVLAAGSGTVAGVSTGEFAGLFVTIDHGNGWSTRYMHLSKALVQKGQSVHAGQVIGQVGTSGTVSASPHLHFDTQLREDLLNAYVQTFGQPRGGFGTKRALGVTVPSEPLVPVRGYAKIVISDAKANGIPLFTPQGVAWHKWFVGLGVVAFVGLLGVSYYRRRKRLR